MKEYSDVFNCDYELGKNQIRLKDMIFDKKVKDIIVPLGIEYETKRRRYIDFNDISCLLVGGQTGSGKSVFLDSIIVSLLLNNKNIQFVMMDPKMIELAFYNNIPNTTKKVISNNVDCFKELEKIYTEYNNRKKLIKNYKNFLEYNKKENKKLDRLFIIIDESCRLMEIDGSEEVLYEMIHNSCLYGIHFIIASNSIWKKYFSPKFMNAIKYIVTFDLADEKDAKMIGSIKAKYLSTPGNALVLGDVKYQEIDLQTPYISDEEILNAINYCINKK